MVAGVLAGRFVDWFAEEEKMTAFIVIFIIVTLLGFIGHLIINRGTPRHAGTGAPAGRADSG